MYHEVIMSHLLLCTLVVCNSEVAFGLVCSVLFFIYMTELIALFLYVYVALCLVLSCAVLLCIYL